MDQVKAHWDVKMKWRQFAHGKNMACVGEGEGGRDKTVLVWTVSTNQIVLPRTASNHQKTERGKEVWCSPICLFFLLFPFFEEIYQKNIKETINKIQRQHTAWKNIFVNDTSVRS